MAKFRYRATMRARVGGNEGLFTVEWQPCNPGARDMPFATSFGSSRFDPDPFDFGGIGEVWEKFHPHAQNWLPGWLLGEHICGTEEQWLEGYPAGTPIPPSIGGSPACCYVDHGAPFDYGFDFGFES